MSNQAEKAMRGVVSRLGMQGYEVIGVDWDGEASEGTIAARLEGVPAYVSVSVTEGEAPFPSDAELLARGKAAALAYLGKGGQPQGRFWVEGMSAALVGGDAVFCKRYRADQRWEELIGRGGMRPA